MNQTEKPALYALTEDQRKAISFVLGHYAGFLPESSAKTNPQGLKSSDLIALGAMLEGPGLTFSNVVPLFAEGSEDNAYVLAAKKHVRDGDIEVDDPAVVSEGGDPGAYVMAWVWVSDEEARCTTIDGYDVVIGEDGECSINKEVKGRAYGASLDELVNNEELVCPTSGMGNNHYHRVERATIEKISAFAKLVEDTIPTEE